ncbi:MAG: alanine racemase [Clostridia bacterium]|nr:alanine racemase [Clostridia bacterium]
MNNCIKIINTNALEHNLKYIKRQLSKNTKLCAVVKDDAYGHGIKNVLPTLLCYADYFAVATIDEAIQLRNLTTLPILILGEFQIADLDKVIKNNLEITISSIQSLKEVIEIEKTKTINVHIAIDSGMHRLGFYKPQDFTKAIKLIQKHKNIILKGVYSHVGDAQNIARLENQKLVFDKFYSLMPSSMHPIIHIANTDTMQSDNTMHCDMVRTGIGIYGYGNSELIPIMSVAAKIVHTIHLGHDDFVGYGSTHRLHKGTILGVVAIGYGQGYLRAYGQFGSVIVNGKLCKIVANVCMDMLIIDITKATWKIGDYAIIMGKQGMHTIDANLLATFGKTISYEVLTNFGQIKNSVLVHN